VAPVLRATVIEPRATKRRKLNAARFCGWALFLSYALTTTLIGLGALVCFGGLARPADFRFQISDFKSGSQTSKSAAYELARPFGGKRSGVATDSPARSGGISDLPSRGCPPMRLPGADLDINPRGGLSNCGLGIADCGLILFSARVATWPACSMSNQGRFGVCAATYEARNGLAIASAARTAKLRLKSSAALASEIFSTTDFPDFHRL
jgi:hypothetical protein